MQAIVLTSCGPLTGYAGLMQADAYAGFGRLYEPARGPGPIVEAACWAYARRKLYEIAELKKAPIAIEAVKRINATVRRSGITKPGNGRRGNSVKGFRRGSPRLLSLPLCTLHAFPASRRLTSLRRGLRRSARV
jgi:hypothetical protein